MAFVLDGSDPWTWNSLIGGSGSEASFLDVPPWKRVKGQDQPCTYENLQRHYRESRPGIIPRRWPFYPWTLPWNVWVLCPWSLSLGRVHHRTCHLRPQPEKPRPPLRPVTHDGPEWTNEWQVKRSFIIKEKPSKHQRCVLWQTFEHRLNYIWFANTLNKWGSFSSRVSFTRYLFPVTFNSNIHVIKSRKTKNCALQLRYMSNSVYSENSNMQWYCNGRWSSGKKILNLIY